MFEFGKDLRKIFAQARESDDLSWLELIGVNLVDVKAGIVNFKNISAQNGGIGVNVERGTYDELNFGDVDAGGNPKNG